MPKFAYFAIEMALLATVPATYFMDQDFVAMLARILCVLLLGVGFILGTADDRFAVFGLLLALVSGVLWSAQIFGVLYRTGLWATYVFVLAELLIRWSARTRQPNTWRLEEVLSSWGKVTAYK